MSSHASFQQLPVEIMAPSPMLVSVCRGVHAGANRDDLTLG